MAEHRGNEEAAAATAHAARARAEYDGRIHAEQRLAEEATEAEKHARQDKAEHKARCQFESLAARPAPALAPGRLPALPKYAVRVYPAGERADTPPGWTTRQCVRTHLRPEVYRMLGEEARPACANPGCRRIPRDEFWVARRGRGHNFCWRCYELSDPEGAATIARGVEARRQRQLQPQAAAAPTAEGAMVPPP